MKFKSTIILFIALLITLSGQAMAYETNTGLDLLTDLILADPGLAANIPADEIDAGANASYEMNLIIIEAIKATDAWIDGYNETDIYNLNSYIRNNYLAVWTDLHGDDENGEEWGFHYVQNDGATTQLYGENAINTVADGVYHLGFEIQNGVLLNEDGNPNVAVSTLAQWLNYLLVNDDFSPAPEITSEENEDKPDKNLHIANINFGRNEILPGEDLFISLNMENDDFDSATVRVTCFGLGISRKYTVYSDSDNAQLRTYIPIYDHIQGRYDCRITINTDNGITRTKHREINLIR